MVSELSGPSLNRREGGRGGWIGGGVSGGGEGGEQVRETLSSSDLLFFLGLKTLPFFHPQLCTQRNRKRLHHSIHPSSLAKRPVTIIDFSLSLLTASNTSEPVTPGINTDDPHLRLLIIFSLFFVLFFFSVWYSC